MNWPEILSVGKVASFGGRQIFSCTFFSEKHCAKHWANHWITLIWTRTKPPPFPWITKPDGVTDNGPRSSNVTSGNSIWQKMPSHSARRLFESSSGIQPWKKGPINSVGQSIFFVCWHVLDILSEWLMFTFEKSSIYVVKSLWCN